MGPGCEAHLDATWEGVAPRSLHKHLIPGAARRLKCAAYSPTDPPVLCLLQARFTPTAATDKVISTMQLSYQWSDFAQPNVGKSVQFSSAQTELYAYVKGLVETARHGDMGAVFPALPSILLGRDFWPVGLCLVKFVSNRQICTCPAGMSLDASGVSCTNSTSERESGSLASRVSCYGWLSCGCTSECLRWAHAQPARCACV